ncbi:hypothetical protein NDU88_003116 [Pleurodeles waltl]|uniref:Uncharacterized protein n=1 Tax=Pleurodeles waltl TaxID=8319 RepID=A0AAV7TPL2_PLEWA|nr:hypothetical protein NDU88_003116 [Pleurodeles waltl]
MYCVTCCSVGSYYVPESNLSSCSGSTGTHYVSAVSSDQAPGPPERGDEGNAALSHSCVSCMPLTVSSALYLWLGDHLQCLALVGLAGETSCACTCPSRAPVQQSGYSVTTLPSHKQVSSAGSPAPPIARPRSRHSPPLHPSPRRVRSSMPGLSRPCSRSGTSCMFIQAAWPSAVPKHRRQSREAGGTTIPQPPLVAPAGAPGHACPAPRPKAGSAPPQGS